MSFSVMDHSFQVCNLFLKFVYKRRRTIDLWKGDYRIGEALLGESASVITFCEAPTAPTPAPEQSGSMTGSPTGKNEVKGGLSLSSLTNAFSRSRAPSPSEPALPTALMPRRMVVLVVGLKPHRKLWTLSARPGESVINYILLNGCPTFVVPVKIGSPLLAWDTLTIEQLWKIELPDDDRGKSRSGKFEGAVDVVFEYLDLCVDWERTKTPDREGEMSSETEGGEESLDSKKRTVKNAVTLLVAAAIRSKDSKAARKELEADRCGIAMWRIP